jgi:chromosome segregation ATPase
VLDQKNQFGSLARQIQSRQQEVESINKDQARLRENMKALKGSAEEKALLQRYTRQLDSQEDRLNTLTKETVDLQQKYVQVQSQLDRMLQEMRSTSNSDPGFLPKVVIAVPRVDFHFRLEYTFEPVRL